MTSTHAFPGVLPRALPSAFSDVATKVINFSLVAIAFVFASILLTGIRP